MKDPYLECLLAAAADYIMCEGSLPGMSARCCLWLCNMWRISTWNVCSLPPLITYYVWRIPTCNVCSMLSLITWCVKDPYLECLFAAAVDYIMCDGSLPGISVSIPNVNKFPNCAHVNGGHEQTSQVEIIHMFNIICKIPSKRTWALQNALIFSGFTSVWVTAKTFSIYVRTLPCGINLFQFCQL